MKLLYRRALFVGFTLLFFITAPLLLFYASGYRYHFEKGRVEQVGQLYITSTPKGADVFLDGKPYINELDKFLSKKIERTPTRLQDLLPGEYTLDVKKDGYWDWSRDVTITPQKTTFASDLFLLKKTNPELFFGKDGVVDFLPDGNQAAYYITEKDFGRYDSLSRESRVIWTSKDVIERFWQAPVSQDLFLLKTKTDWWIIDRGAPYSLKSLGVVASNVRWGDDGVQLFVLDQEKNLSLFDWRAKKKVVLADGVIDFFATDLVYFITKNTTNGSVELWKRSLGVLAGREKMAVFSSNNVSFLSANRSFLAMKTDSGVVITDARTPNKASVYADGLTKVYWLSEKEAFISNDFEIWRYIFSDNHYDRELITRQGEILSGVVGEKILPYVFFFKNDNSMIALERGVAEVANLYILSSGDSLKLSRMGVDGKRIFFYGTIAGKSGIFVLPLID